MVKLIWALFWLHFYSSIEQWIPTTLLSTIRTWRLFIEYPLILFWEIIEINTETRNRKSWHGHKSNHLISYPIHRIHYVLRTNQKIKQQFHSISACAISVVAVWNECVCRLVHYKHNERNLKLTLTMIFHWKNERQKYMSAWTGCDAHKNTVKAKKVFLIIS